jgi:hypothetical protein
MALGRCKFIFGCLLQFGQLSNRAPAPPRFCGGEGGRRPDEGAFDCRGAVAPMAEAPGSKSLISRRTCLLWSCNAPLIRLRHLLPPQETRRKKPRGEKALDGKEVQEGRCTRKAPERRRVSLHDERHFHVAVAGAAVVVADRCEAASFVRGDGHVGRFAYIGIEVDLERFD